MEHPDRGHDGRSRDVGRYLLNGGGLGRHQGFSTFCYNLDPQYIVCYPYRRVIPTMFRPRTLLALPLLLGGIPPAQADATLIAGQTVVVASYYELRGPNCQAMNPPHVRIVTRPTLGALTIVRGEANTGGGGRCAYTSVPVSQLLYRAQRPGSETITWEVRYQDRGRKVERVSAQITVGAANPSGTTAP